MRENEVKINLKNLKNWCLNTVKVLSGLLLSCAFQSIAADNQIPSAPLPNLEIVQSNSLEGVTALAVLPQYWAFSFPSLQTKADQIVIKELEKIGSVVIVDDPSGFGKSQVRMGLTMKNISLLNEKNPAPIVLASLSLFAGVQIQRLNRDSSALMWGIQAFTTGQIEEKNEQKLLEAVRALVSWFKEEYETANSGQKKKPVFYFYKNGPA